MAGNIADAEGEQAATILMPPTPADGYLATDLLMAEGPSSVWGDLGIDQVLSDIHRDEEDFVDAVDAILAGLLDERVA